jgi:WD40 repeat protein
MSQQNCPDIADVRRYLLGQLSHAEGGPLEAHLLQCRRCAELAESLTAEDVLLGALRAQKGAAPDPDSDLIEQVIGRLKALSVADNPLSNGVTGAAAGNGWLAGPETETDFAAPTAGSATSRTTATDVPHIPGYEVLGELGRGGMGVVYRARQVGLNRTVALKMILAGSHAGTSLLTRFRAEAETVARLQHPHIVQVHEVGEVGGLPYCALEFCDGGSLAERLRGGPLPAAEATRMTEKLAGAMHAAHQVGIVHRDLKPANVLLTADGSPKVTDFGLAKCLDVEAGQTRSGDLLGTPSYMAPEQARGSIHEIAPHTDVYALGTILYELLTGRPPFKAATVLETLDLVRNAEPAPPRQLQPMCPRDLEIICLKCLRKEPAQRYATALELADDLRRFQNGEPIHARPVGLVERVLRWMWRRPNLALLFAVVLLAVAALLGLSFWYVHNLGQAEARADEREYFRLFSQVRERRADPQPGWTWDSLADLRQAVRLPAAAEHLAELRSEAASALGAIDVRRRGVVAENLNAGSLAFHPRGRWLALGPVRAADHVAYSVSLIDLERKGADRILSVPVEWMNSVVARTPDGVRTLAFSPNGRWLVAGTRHGSLHRWDLTCEPPALVSWPAHKGEVNWLFFHPQGTVLFSASAGEKTVKRWTTVGWTGPDKPEAPARGENRTLDSVYQAGSEIGGLAMHPAEGWLTCSAGGTTAFLSPDTLQPLRPALGRGMGKMHFSPDGFSLLFELGGVIQFLNLHNDQILRQLRAPESDQSHDGPLSALALSPDGALLASASEDTKHVKLWEVASGRLPADLFVGSGTVKAAFSPDGRTLAVSTEKGTLLYEIGGLDVQTFAALQEQPVHSVALYPDGRSLACLSRSVWHDEFGDVTVWPLREGAAPAVPQPALAPSLRHTFVLDQLPAVEQHILTAQPGSSLLAFGAGSHLVCWDTATAGETRFQKQLHFQTELNFAPDGRLWGTIDKEAHVWEPGTGQLLASWSDRLTRMQGGLDSLYGVAAGRKRVAVAGRNGSVSLLQAANADLEGSRQVADNPVRCVALNGDETLVAAGTDQGDLRLLRAAGAEVVAGMTPHRDGVTALSFGGNELLASGSRDKTVKLWRWDGTALTELLTLRQPARVRWLAFHADGVRLLVLLEGERAVRVWHLDRLCSHLTEMNLGAGLEGIEPTSLPPAIRVSAPPPVTTPPEGPNGLRAELFADTDLQHCVKVRYDPQIDFDWGDGSPDPLVPADFFSVRWTGWLKAPKPGKYTLRLEADDGARLWLDGRLLIARWQWPLTKSDQVEVELGDRPHELRVEYFEGIGDASVRLSWAQKDGFGMEPVPPSALFHDRAVAEKAP